MFGKKNNNDLKIKKPWSPTGRGQKMNAQMYLSTNDESYLPTGVTASQVRAWDKTRQAK